MTDKRIQKAVRLREQGVSIARIATEIGAAKSSVSIWTKHVVLTEDQRRELQRNSYSYEAIEKRRSSRLLSELRKRDAAVALAREKVGKLNYRELWLIGTALYWAEGGKTQRMVRFSNGDPEMIIFMMRYFREVCKVPEHKFTGHIHIHENLDVQKAEEYWSGVSGVDQQKFYKTYNKKNTSSKNKRKTLPYGVFDIYVLDVKLFLKIQGWIEGIAQK